MNRSARRLEEYVRQATGPSEDQAAMLVDPVARRAILEEVTRMQTYDSPAPPRQPVRRRVVLAVVGAAVAVVAVAAFVSTNLFGASDQGPPVAAATTPQPQPRASGDVFGDAGGFSCVERYTLQTLATRGFAFAGTVASIGQLSPGEDADPYVPVVFTVDKWFRGGPGGEVAVWMLPPEAVTSVGTTPYKVGSRLLVSGERRAAGERPNDLLAWACGFTRWYGLPAAGEWERAFG